MEIYSHVYLSRFMITIANESSRVLAGETNRDEGGIHAAMKVYQNGAWRPMMDMVQTNILYPRTYRWRLLFHEVC